MSDRLEGESIVCFAGEDWWYHHPHSKNHLLKRYARGNKVLFVNSISMGLPSMANPDFFLKIRRKLKSYTRWLRKVPEGAGQPAALWMESRALAQPGSAGGATAPGDVAAAHLAADSLGGHPYSSRDGGASG
jgi:hypothetical protein